MSVALTPTHAAHAPGRTSLHSLFSLGQTNLTSHEDLVRQKEIREATLVDVLDLPSPESADPKSHARVNYFIWQLGETRYVLPSSYAFYHQTDPTSNARPPAITRPRRDRVDRLFPSGMARLDSHSFHLISSCYPPSEAYCTLPASLAPWKAAGDWGHPETERRPWEKPMRTSALKAGSGPPGVELLLIHFPHSSISTRNIPRRHQTPSSHSPLRHLLPFPSPFPSSSQDVNLLLPQRYSS